MLLRILSVLIGLSLIFFTVISAARTFLVPRGIPDRLSRLVYIVSRRLFNLRLIWAKSYTQKDRVMAYYAPLTLIAFPFIWLTLITLGFNAIYWGVGVRSWAEAFRLSGSAITTLGFASADSVLEQALIFTEATAGLVLVAILISYLPTMYSAYSDRETAVTLLDVRAGSPPSSIELIKRTHRIGLQNDMTAFWQEWELWFARVEESHTSLPSLIFYRSPVPEYSWVIAAGVVLDSAALFNAVIEKPHDPQEDLCLRAGYLALRRIASFFGVQYKEFPTSEDPISISRAEFDAACAEMAAVGIPLKADRDQAWRDFSGWRVNYDTVLLSLCNIVMAPYAHWSSDRAHLHSQFSTPPLFFMKRQ